MHNKYSNNISNNISINFNKNKTKYTKKCSFCTRIYPGDYFAEINIGCSSGTVCIDDLDKIINKIEICINKCKGENYMKTKIFTLNWSRRPYPTCYNCGESMTNYIRVRFKADGEHTKHPKLCKICSRMLQDELKEFKDDISKHIFCEEL